MARLSSTRYWPRDEMIFRAGVDCLTALCASTIHSGPSSTFGNKVARVPMKPLSPSTESPLIEQYGDRIECDFTCALWPMLQNTLTNTFSSTRAPVLTIL